MKTHLPILVAILLVISSCGSAPDATDVAAQAAIAGVERVVTEVAISEGAPVTMADLSIDGMSCEMMCGGSIKKALAKLPGVSGTEIKYVEGDERDHAIVTYDPAQVTDAQMVEAIQALHEGQYKVLAVNITKQVLAPGGAAGDANTTKEDKAVSVRDASSTVLPSILALLTQILRS
jgi:copper chaperone CopZ